MCVCVSNCTDTGMFTAVCKVHKYDHRCTLNLGHAKRGLAIVILTHSLSQKSKVDFKQLLGGMLG